MGSTYVYIFLLIQSLNGRGRLQSTTRAEQYSTCTLRLVMYVHHQLNLNLSYLTSTGLS